MSLFITFKSGRSRELWVQDLARSEVRYQLHGMACGVESVQADGDELDMIRTNCTNLPNSTGRVQRWFGDHAKFIVGNI